MFRKKIIIAGIVLVLGVVLTLVFAHAAACDQSVLTHASRGGWWHCYKYAIICFAATIGAVSAIFGF